MPLETIIVDENSNQLRLDVFLTQSFPDLPSRTYIKSLIDEGHVLLNDKKVKANHKVITGDTITIDVIKPEDPLENIEPEDIPLDIFYEDKYLMVINKPVGMVVHPAPGVTSGTLVNAILFHCQKNEGRTLSDVNEHFRPGIVHRLDKETSGLMLVAKDNVTHVRLGRMFEKRRIQKQYIAVVQGAVEFDEGIVDAPLGKDSKHWDKRSVAKPGEGKEASTHYYVKERFGKEKTKVSLYPQSGRTHQLRVHMAHIGHPILGDNKYGTKGSHKRMLLHAKSLKFQHPHTKKDIEFSTPLPEDFNL